MSAPQGAGLLWQGYREPAAWVALIWSALGPGALAAYLQTQVCISSRGQHACMRSAFHKHHDCCEDVILVTGATALAVSSQICRMITALAWLRDSQCGTTSLQPRRAVSVVSQGQSKVPAPQAQIIFSSLPLWSAFFAAVLAQGDSMGPSGWAGGFLILAAGLIASRKS